MHQISKIYFVIKPYMFGPSSVPIIRSYRCTLGDWYVSCRLCDRLLAETGWNFLHVSGIFCVHHQELSLYTRQLVRFMQVMWPLKVPTWLCLEEVTWPARNAPTAECTAITPDDGRRRCPKHVEFYDKTNFGYFKHLVGCFIRISLKLCCFLISRMDSISASNCLLRSL
jgi:hypothetical protein